MTHPHEERASEIAADYGNPFLRDRLENAICTLVAQAAADEWAACLLALRIIGDKQLQGPENYQDGFGDGVDECIDAIRARDREPLARRSPMTIPEHPNDTDLPVEIAWQAPIMQAVENYCILLVSRPDDHAIHEKWRLRICQAFEDWFWRPPSGPRIGPPESEVTP